jgi:hypothetical protein
MSRSSRSVGMIRATDAYGTPWVECNVGHRRPGCESALAGRFDVEAFRHLRHIIKVFGIGAIADRAGRAGAAAITRTVAQPGPVRMVLANPAAIVAAGAESHRSIHQSGAIERDCISPRGRLARKPTFICPLIFVLPNVHCLEGRCQLFRRRPGLQGCPGPCELGLGRVEVPG